MDNEYLQRPLRLTVPQIESTLIICGAHRTKIQGNNVQADHCFLHHNNSPTLGVRSEWPHQWQCFSCHAKGPDIISLVERARKISRAEAFAWLVEHFEIELDSTPFSFKQRLAFQEEAPRFVLSKNALAAYPLDADDGIGYRAAHYYLGIDRKTADLFRLGYRTKDHRLIFPVWHADGALAGLIGRSMLRSCSPKHRWYNFDAGEFKRERVLMGAELPIVPDRPIIVVEGPRDFFKLRALGWPNVRSTLGSSASQWQLELLASYGCDIVPLYDMDSAGRTGAHMLRKALRGHAHVLSFRFPAAAFDPDTGKGDPAMLTTETLAELTASFVRGFNFTQMSRLAKTPC